MPEKVKEKSLARLLTQASRAHRNRLGIRLAALGLMAGQEQVLLALDAKGPMGTGELAAILHVRPPTVSKMITRLGATGLVERNAATNGDNRGVTISLTPNGAAKVVAVNALWQETENELLRDIDAKDVKRLRKILRQAVRNLSDTAPADDEAE